MKICVFNTTNNLIQPVDVATVLSGLALNNLDITSPTPLPPGGNFSFAHGLPSTPVAVILQTTSSGDIWFQDALFDGTYLYLTASAIAQTAVAVCITLTDEGVLNSLPFSQPSSTIAAPSGVTTYTLPSIPAYPNASFYFVNGLKKQYGIFYTIAGNTLIILETPPPQTGDSHEIYYSTSGEGGGPYSQPPAIIAAPSGITTYVLPSTPADPTASLYFVNGIKRKYGVFYTIFGNTLTELATIPPQTGDSHEIYYS